MSAQISPFSTATELSKRLAAGDTTAVALAELFLQRAESTSSQLKAYLEVTRTTALAQAEASDARRAAGKVLGPLDGIPVGLKDNMAVTGQKVSCSSRMLENFVSPYDGTVIRKLKEQGMVFIGRLNLDEFAMGSSTENSAFQTTSNPWNLECIPGGSSGGSAAAVAAGTVPLSLGSDTGGSIRQPASLCGVVGLKPTYGMVSRYGLVAFASSLDQIGPFARTVEDAALLLQAIVGEDPYDSTSYVPKQENYVEALKTAERKWRVGVPREFFGEGLSAEVRAAVEAALKWYESQGCELIDVSLPHTDLSIPVYYIIATAEASSNLARFDGIRYTHRAADAVDGVDLYFKSRGQGFGEEVKRRIILGTYVLSTGYYDAYYLKAQKVRTLIRRDFDQAFEKVDFIATPTSPTVAFKRGEKNADPLAMYLSDIYTISTNLAGLPGLSMPCGFSSDGLPIGLQLIGQQFGESDLLAAAHYYDAHHDHNRQTPPTFS
jgi:aspartyl-tRNA(Asn)/glutamyl-tRNA(Gln) amidotransferase subunit A